MSGNLVVRFAGPGDLLASGHPEGAGSLPENLGLIRSRDHGETWESVAGLGEGDYHELEVAGDLLVAVNAESPDIQVSRDGGRSWEAKTPPAPPIDVVVDPGTRSAGRSPPKRARSARATAEVVAAARPDVRRAPDLARVGRALQHRPQREGARLANGGISWPIAETSGPASEVAPAERTNCSRPSRRKGPPVAGRRSPLGDDRDLG